MVSIVGEVITIPLVATVWIIIIVALIAIAQQVKHEKAENEREEQEREAGAREFDAELAEAKDDAWEAETCTVRGCKKSVPVQGDDKSKLCDHHKAVREVEQNA